MDLDLPSFSGALKGSEQFFPYIFFATIFLAFLFLGSSVNMIVPLLFFFAPSFLLMRYILKLDITTSTVFALPFCIAASSIFFRIGLLFSTSASMGWLVLAIGWIVLATIAFWLRSRSDISFSLLKPGDDVARFQIFFILISVISLIAYTQILDPIGPTVLWNSNDANWQVALLTYLDAGTFEMPSYVCGGHAGYDLDNFTSTTSVLPSYFMKSLSGLPAGMAQMLFLYLGFMLFTQGIFVLFSRMFNYEVGFLSFVFVTFPVFSTHVYMTELLGIWRVSLLNAFFPWTLIFGFFWINNTGSMFLRTALVIFTFPLQPLSSILFLPAYITTFFQNFSKSLAIRYSIMIILLLVFVYFTFYQITYQTIGSGGAGGYSLMFGLEEMQNIDTHLTLVPRHQISWTNLGFIVAFLTLAVLIYIAYKLKNNPNPKSSVFLPLFLTILLGAIACSGLVNISESFIQYILKMRYTVFLGLFFPLSALLVIKIIEKQKLLGIVLALALILMSFFNLVVLSKYVIFSSEYYDDVIIWLRESTDPDAIVMYFGPMFPQKTIHHTQRRFVEFPEDMKLAEFGTHIFIQEEEAKCKFKRQGLFYITDDMPKPRRIAADYVITLRNAVLNDYLEASGYYSVYEDKYFAVYGR